MAYFCYRLSDPRPGFPADVTAAEQAAMAPAAMAPYAACRAERVTAGAVIAVGPVFAPDRVFGPAILAADDEAAAVAVVAAGPVPQAALGFGHRLGPMPSLMHR